MDTSHPRKRVVIVGGGFAGLRVARRLASADVEVTLVDRRNHHLFQPLLYQVASAGLSATDIAVPLRRVVRKDPDTRVIMGEVVNVDLSSRRVLLAGGAELAYDYLVLAAGAEPNYFGNDEWERHAPSLKSLDSALRLRERLLLTLERAELESSAELRQQLLSMVVVGAGPTGVELAGALAELGRAVPEEYARIAPGDVRVTLVEMGDRVLPGFHGDSSRAAQRMLESLGVEVRLGTRVEDVDGARVVHSHGELQSRSVSWCSGVKPVGLTQAIDAERDKSGRLQVTGDCSLDTHPEVFVLGDMAHFERQPGGEPLPALAAVAVQQGSSVADNIARDVRRRPRHAFQYQDKGTMATVGRGRAVADLGRLHLHGLPAFALWSGVHIYQLFGLRNQASVLMDWTRQYITPTRRTAGRIITEREGGIRYADDGKPKPVQGLQSCRVWEA